MLDQIKKYAPKTAESLSKVIAARENSVKKIMDYEQQIKDLDEQIMNLETESCKNPNNPKTNEKLELLSAKRYGLHFRYEALKNGSAAFYSKEDIDKILDVYKNEFANSLMSKVNQNNSMSSALREEYNQKVRVMEQELRAKQNTLDSEINEYKNTIETISQTLVKHYLSLGLEPEEVKAMMTESKLPYPKNINKAL